MRHQHEEGDAGSGAENDDGAEHVQIFDDEIQRHRFFAAVGAGGFSARSSSGPAIFTPASVSASQWPSLPDAASTRKSTLSAAAAERVGQLPRQRRREIAVVGRHQPCHRHARAFAELGRGRNQRVRRADLIGEIVGVAAAPGREGNDGGDALRVLAGQRQRAPGAGRVPDNDRAVLPDEGLPAQIFSAEAIAAAVARPAREIVGFVAAALVLEIASAGRAMAQAFRHQHRKAPRHQPGRQRAVFGLRHLRATQHVLRRGVRDQRQRKRPIAGRAKQHGVRRGVRIGRRHQPLLHAVWLGFGALRAEPGLRRRGLGTDRSKHNQSEKRLARLHEFA